MANIHDVAKRAGVASVTVSRYLNGTAPVGTEARRKIESAIRDLGYVPNALAQSLKSRATRTIGLVVTDVTNPFFTSIARGVEDVAQEAGYSVILCNSDEDAEKQALYLEVLRRKRVDGLLIAPASDEGRAIAEWGRACGPVCILDRTIEQVDVSAAGVDVVRSDSVEPAARLVRHLLSHGHRRIAIVTGPLDISTARARLEGYRRALEDAQIERDPALERAGPYTVESGYASTLALLDVPSPPSAIFAANNFLTIGVLAALRERRLLVPGDVAVVGFDEIPQIALATPFLSVAAQSASAIGRQGAGLLLERLAVARAGAASAPGRELVLDTELIIRESCGCSPMDRDTSRRPVIALAGEGRAATLARTSSAPAGGSDTPADPATGNERPASGLRPPRPAAARQRRPATTPNRPNDRAPGGRDLERERSGPSTRQRERDPALFPDGTAKGQAT